MICFTSNACLNLRVIGAETRHLRLASRLEDAPAPLPRRRIVHRPVHVEVVLPHVEPLQEMVPSRPLHLFFNCFFFILFSTLLLFQLFFFHSSSWLLKSSSLSRGARWWRAPSARPGPLARSPRWSCCTAAAARSLAVETLPKTSQNDARSCQMKLFSTCFQHVFNMFSPIRMGKEMNSCRGKAATLAGPTALGDVVRDPDETSSKSQNSFSNHRNLDL